MKKNGTMTSSSIPSGHAVVTTAPASGGTSSMVEYNALGATPSASGTAHGTAGTPSSRGSKASKLEEVPASISPGDHTGISKGEGPHRANFPRILANLVVGIASS